MSESLKRPATDTATDDRPTKKQCVNSMVATSLLDKDIKWGNFYPHIGDGLDFEDVKGLVHNVFEMGIWGAFAGNQEDEEEDVSDPIIEKMKRMYEAQLKEKCGGRDIKILASAPVAVFCERHESDWNELVKSGKGEILLSVEDARNYISARIVKIDQTAVVRLATEGLKLLEAKTSAEKSKLTSKSSVNIFCIF